MSPPIRDGSGDSIGSIRLGDGSEISEVRTGAGDVLFTAAPPIPDSVIALYDPTQESGFVDGDAINTQTDFIGSADISGQATYRTNVRNSEPVVRYDGVDDEFDIPSTNFNTLTQPFTIILAIVDLEQQTGNFPAGYETFLHQETDTDPQVIVQWLSTRNTNAFTTNAGSGLIGTATTPPLILSAVFDGTNSILRENGQQTASGDVGSNDLESIRVGSYPTDERYWNGDQGEYLIYDANLSNTGELSSEEQRLAAKYNITL